MVLLRHVLPLAGVAAAASASALSTNVDNFTLDDAAAVASDMANRVFRSFPTSGKFFLDGLVDSISPYAVSPIFWAALLHHSHLSNGKDDNFTPEETFTPEEGFGEYSVHTNVMNEDLALWAQLALTAADYNFHPEGLNEPWLKYAENVFDYQVQQWMTPRISRNGGIPSTWAPLGASWSTWSSMYTAQTNGNFFHLSARLARTTGDQKYLDWASKAYDWMEQEGIITAAHNVTPHIYSFRSLDPKVPVSLPYLISSDSGVIAAGAAYIYNVTNGDAKWKQRVEDLVAQIATNFFSPDGVLIEGCETKTEQYFFPTCYTPDIWYKAQVPLLLASVVQHASFTGDRLVPLLRSTAAAAARSCVNSTDTPCKSTLVQGHYDPKSPPDETGDYVAALNAMNAARFLKVFPATPKSKEGGDDARAENPKYPEPKQSQESENSKGSENDNAISTSKDDKSTASSLPGPASVWGVALIVAGIMSM